MGFECKHVRVNAKCFSHLRHSPSGDPRGCLGCEQGVTCPQGGEPHTPAALAGPCPTPPPCVLVSAPGSCPGVWGRCCVSAKHAQPGLSHGWCGARASSFQLALLGADSGTCRPHRPLPQLGGTVVLCLDPSVRGCDCDSSPGTGPSDLLSVITVVRHLSCRPSVAVTHCICSVVSGRTVWGQQLCHGYVGRSSTPLTLAMARGEEHTHVLLMGSRRDARPTSSLFEMWSSEGRQWPRGLTGNSRPQASVQTRGRSLRLNQTQGGSHGLSTEGAGQSVHPVSPDPAPGHLEHAPPGAPHSHHAGLVNVASLIVRDAWGTLSYCMNLWRSLDPGSHCSLPVVPLQSDSQRTIIKGSDPQG